MDHSEICGTGSISNSSCCHEIFCCEGRLPSKKNPKKKRWNAIAKSAAEQSKRLIVPEVGEVLSYKECLKEWENLDLVLVPYESAKGMETIQKTLETVKNGMKIGILIGPEGGISEQEIEEAKASGAKIVSLGKRILRTETAALAMLSILMYRIRLRQRKQMGEKEERVIGV